MYSILTKYIFQINLKHKYYEKVKFTYSSNFFVSCDSLANMLVKLASRNASLGSVVILL